MKNFLKVTVLAFLAGFGGSYTFYSLVVKSQLANQANIATASVQQVSNDTSAEGYQLNNPANTTFTTLPNVDFSDASAKATQSVVFINSI